MALPPTKLLPREVLHHVFTLLERDRKTLLQLQLTCKEWAQVAREIFYKSVNVSTNALKASSLKRALQTPDNSASHYIRHFEFSTSALSDNTSLSSIVSCCPNLRSIKQFIAETRCNYYPELLALRQQGHLQHLEQVDTPPLYPNGEAANDDYVQLMLASRESITKLHLCSYSSDQPSDFALTKHLAAFDHLKEVEIVSKAGITMRQMSTVLDSKHPYQKIVVKSLRPAEDPHSTEGNSSCAGVRTLPQLKAADLHVRSFSVTDIQLIKHVLPRLNKLNIYSQGKPMPPERDQLERFEELFEYVSHIDSFSIGKLLVSTDLMFALLANATNYFCVDQIQVILDSSEDSKHHGFRISTKDTACIKSSTKGSKPNCGIDLLVNVKQVTNVFCQHLFKLVAEKVKPLSVVLYGTRADEDSKKNKILGDCVDDILIHCRSLKELELYYLPLSSSGYFPDNDVLFMDYLSVYECSMDIDYLADISMAIGMLDKMFLYRGKIMTLGYGFDMPNTVIGTLHLFDIALDSVFKIKIGLNVASQYYRYCYQDTDERYEKVTEKEYKQAKKLASYSEEDSPVPIKIGALDAYRILCGPSEDDHFMTSSSLHLMMALLCQMQQRISFLILTYYTMKDNWASLPQEILLHIFQYVSEEQDIFEKHQDKYKKNLQQLQLINKNWSNAARKLFYETISLRRSEEQVALLLQTLESPKNEPLSHAVRKLSFTTKAIPNDLKLQALIKRCLNVSILDFCCYDSNSNHYTLLSKLHQEGYLQRLRVIPAPEPNCANYKSLVPGYENTMLCLAATATALTIDSKSGTAELRDIAKNLASFVSLEKLTIRGLHAIRMNEISRLFVNNLPPQLNSIELLEGYGTNTSTVDYPTSDISILGQVEKLALQSDDLSIQNLSHIVRMFPGLKELCIEPFFDEVTYSPQVNNQTSSLAFAEFSRYVSQIKNLYIWILSMSPEVLLESLNSLVKFNGVDSVEFNLYHPGDVETAHLTVRKGRFLGGGVKAYNDYELSLLVDFDADYHLKLIKAALVNTNVRRLMVIARKEYFDQFGTPAKYGACLEYILSHCGTIKQLHIESVTIDSMPNDIATQLSGKLNLSRLELKDCRVSQDAYTRMSHRIMRVGLLEVKNPDIDSGDDDDVEDRCKAQRIDMPFTIFGTFVYANDDWNDFVVKVVSYARIVTLKVSKGKSIQILTAPEARSFPTLTICCLSLSSFSVKGCGSIKV
ncbi:hypothetical protein MBANPS3_005361 [Mucor bainieri]